MHEITHYPNGQVNEEQWTVARKLHREDGPAVLKWNSDGSLRREEWHQNGELHREGDPAVTVWAGGKVFQRHWCLHGRDHRDDGPSFRVFNPDGSLHSEFWSSDGRDITDKVEKWARTEASKPADQWEEWTDDDWRGYKLKFGRLRRRKTKRKGSR